MKIYLVHGTNLTIMLTHIGKLLYSNSFSEEHGICRSSRGFLFAPYPISSNCDKIVSDWSLGFEHSYYVSSNVDFKIIEYVMNLDTDVNVAVISYGMKNGFNDIHYQIKLYSNNKTDLEKARVMLSLEHNIE